MHNKFNLKLLAVYAGAAFIYSDVLGEEFFKM
jgi:hypothetical protein